MSFIRTIKSQPAELFIGENIFFRLIENEDDLKYAILFCKVKPHQDEDVWPAGFSIGRAWLNPDNNAPFVVCNKSGEKVGFIQLINHPGDTEYFSWSVMIDAQHQGNGYGTQATALAVKVLKTIAPEKEIVLDVVAENKSACALYEKLGFTLRKVIGIDRYYVI